MPDWIAITLLGAVATYFGVGIGFALVFVFRGVAAIDPAAANSSLGFRAIIAPGAAALWPWLAVRWVRGASGAKP